MFVVDSALEDLLEAVAAADVCADLDGPWAVVLGGADEAVICAVHVECLPLGVARRWLRGLSVGSPA